MGWRGGGGGAWALYHPDYLSYFNYPRHQPYLAISDSNVDWGQGLKQVREWIDAHPQNGRPIYLGYFHNEHKKSPRLDYYLGNRVISLDTLDRPPASGILIISPVWVSGAYDLADSYAALRKCEPVAEIGHCMLVYDLDTARGGGPVVWK